MSNTIYVNVSANNSEMLSENNNKFKYTLPTPVPMPTGTQITCMNSIINLQGITGASIEIEEDLTETIMFQYYLIDTSHKIPTDELGTDVSTDNTRWVCLNDLSSQFHAEKAYGTPSTTPPAGWEYGEGMYAKAVANCSNSTGFT